MKYSVIFSLVATLVLVAAVALGATYRHVESGAAQAKWKFNWEGFIAVLIILAIGVFFAWCLQNFGGTGMDIL